MKLTMGLIKEALDVMRSVDEATAETYQIRTKFYHHDVETYEQELEKYMDILMQSDENIRELELEKANENELQNYIVAAYNIMNYGPDLVKLRAECDKICNFPKGSRCPHAPTDKE